MLRLGLLSMAIPRVQEKSIRAAKRWRVATIKIQAAQRFAKMVHLPEEEKLSMQQGNRQAQLLSKLCPVEDIFSSEKKQMSSYEALLGEAQAAGLAAAFRDAALKPKKSLYYWDFRSTSITPSMPVTRSCSPRSIKDLAATSPKRASDVIKNVGAVSKVRPRMSEEAFDALRIIGSGSSGQVYLVRDRVTGSEYAMKVMNKLDVIAKQRSERVLLEKEILCKMNKHKLFTNLFYAFHTSSDAAPWQSRFFLVLEYCKRGNLHEVVIDHFQRKHNLLTDDEVARCLTSAAAGDGLGTLKEILRTKSENPRVALPRSCVKLILSEVALALDALHTVGYAYRDLKPQNILLHEDGHIRLGDFGVAKVICHRRQGAHRTSTFVGTLEYMAPEIVAGDSQYAHVDWWAYGILAYELLYGKTPFQSKIDCNSGNCQKELFFSIMEPEKIEYPPIPGQKTRSLVQLIQRQLRVNPQKRLNVAQVRSSMFFRNVRWDLLLEGKGPGKYLQPSANPLTRSISSGWPAKLAGMKLDSFLRRQKPTATCSKDEYSGSQRTKGLQKFHSGLTVECRSKLSASAESLCFSEFQWSQT